ncbi:PepSY domain-containing protein [Gallaecimonas sp. GXIMD4217]|uniref:PepSY domain-containing protein n=1 Tax=Gallaecimonas sp. GXIMD4217 TaxID=3131927 RepID=UPI00311B0558
MAALFALLFAVTGLALNHTERLGLADSELGHGLVSRHLYGIQAPEISAFEAGGHWLLQAGTEQLYLDGRPLGQCHALKGAQLKDGQLVLACEDRLFLYRLGDVPVLLDELDANFGLPVPVQALGRAGGDIALWAQGRHWLLDLDSLSLAETERQAHWQSPSPAPARLLAGLSLPTGITVERLLLDLHSGRLLGLSGVLVMDLMALALIFLAGSGIYLWWQSRSKKRRR